MLSWEYLDWEYFWGVLYFSSTSCKYNTATLSYTARIVFRGLLFWGGPFQQGQMWAHGRTPPGAGEGVPFRKRVRQQGHEEAIGLDCAAADHPNLRCRHRSTSPWGCCYGARQARAVKAASLPPPGSLRLASPQSETLTLAQGTPIHHHTPFEEGGREKGMSLEPKWRQNILGWGNYFWDNLLGFILCYDLVVPHIPPALPSITARG